MAKSLLVVMVVLGVLLTGCGKKSVPAGEYQEAVPINELTAVAPSATAVQPAEKAPVAPVMPAVQEAPAVKLEPLPPQGPYKPGAQEIQKALKNAGFYAGEIDGKIGPMSENAIKEFQKANNLQADGKVGPKTWAALSKYLNKQ